MSKRALHAKAINDIAKQRVIKAGPEATGEKGFGFIKPDQGGDDVFVHVSALQASGLADLQDGQKVGFELGQDRRTGKAKAENVRLL